MIDYAERRKGRLPVVWNRGGCFLDSFTQHS